MGERLVRPLLLAAVAAAALTAGGCAKCIKVRDLPPSGPAARIDAAGAVFRAALKSDGSVVGISVKDYCPGGDGVDEISVPWSEGGISTGGPGPAFASIEFPGAAFGDGPRDVTVTACHLDRLELRGYDRNGGLVATAFHPGPRNVPKALTLTGGPISRIDIVGSEIGIDEVCYVK